MRWQIMVATIIGFFLAAGFFAPAQADLIAHWQFDEGSGNIAHDSVGPNHGTLSSSGAGWVATGKVGGALSLDAAAHGLVNMGPVLNNLTGTSFTIAAWVNTTIADESNQMVVAAHRSTDVSGYILGVNTSAGGQYGETKKAWFYNKYPSTTPKSATTVVDGNWHQLVGVRDISTNMVSLYVDGVFQAAYADQGIGTAPANTPLLFGGCLGSDGTTLLSLYTGLLDDIQFYNTALTPGDISYLYNHPGAVIPLPGSLLLLSSGLAGLMAVGFRGRRPRA